MRIVDEDNKIKTQFVFETMSNLYSLECERTRDIQFKATNIINFNGIILAIILAIFSNIYKYVSKNDMFLISTVLAVCIILIFISIYFGIKILDIKKWGCLNSEILRKKYNEIELYDLMNMLSKDLGTIIEDNQKLNTSNTSCLEKSYRMFYFALVMVTILFFYSLISINWNHGDGKINTEEQNRKHFKQDDIPPRKKSDQSVLNVFKEFIVIFKEIVNLFDGFTEKYNDRKHFDFSNENKDSSENKDPSFVDYRPGHLNYKPKRRNKSLLGRVFKYIFFIILIIVVVFLVNNFVI